MKVEVLLKLLDFLVEDGIVAISWPQVNDLNFFNTRKEYKQVLAEEYHEDSLQSIAICVGILVYT